MRRTPKLFRGAHFIGALGVAFAAQLASCHDSTAPSRGGLTIAAVGGPAGAPAAMTITGPNGFTRSATTPATLTDLAPGTYTITAADITTSEGRWSPAQATQSVQVRAATEPTVVTIAYALTTTRLVVTIAGLPAGPTADVLLEGPNGYTRTLTSTTTIDGLPPGTYTIIPRQVSIYPFRYGAPRQTLSLVPSTAQTSVNVSYAAETGALFVDVTGLPNVAASGSVTGPGPGGFEADLAEESFPFLVPGRYTIAAADVTIGHQTYAPNPRTQTADVTAGVAAHATVAYSGPPPAVDLQLVVQGLVSPVFLTAPPGDPRLFIVEQPGRIRIVKDGQLVATPFLDISSRVSYGGERGLLSMAFSPRYDDFPFIYVYFTDLNGDIVVERYTAASDDVANPTPTLVLKIPHPTYGNHNGGLVMFGHDGMLYLGTGDGGGGGDPSGNAQNLDSYLGKLLRIDVNGTLPHVLTRADIWDYGLRNPWRFDVAPGSAQGLGVNLYLADVGQNAFEEIDVVNANAGGQNFDWNRMEGRHCYPSGATTCLPTNPRLLAYEYDHSQGCSITGGFYYLGAAVPWLQNSFLFSDYCGGWLRSLSGDHDNGFTVTTWEIPNIGNVLSFGKDAVGELYMLSANGSVYKIVAK